MIIIIIWLAIYSVIIIIIIWLKSLIDLIASRMDQLLVYDSVAGPHRFRSSIGPVATYECS